MSDEEQSYRLKYIGRRFDGMRLPIDVLSDLPAFRDLLAVYAKNRWLALNPDRKRVPRGFDQSISFDLVALEEGSAIPRLEWNQYAAWTCLDGAVDGLADIVRQAFNAVATLIDDAGHEIFPQSLSSEHVRALNKLGAGLQINERIEFLNTRGKDDSVVYLDHYRRKNLITRVRETYQARFQSAGVLKGVVTEKLTGYIIVETYTHGSIQVPLECERLINEFDGNIGTDVQLDLQIELDNSDKLRSVIDVHEVELIEVSPSLRKCRDRIAYLQALPNGWNGDESAAIAMAAVRSGSQFLTEYSVICSRYNIYPTESSGILFEFESNGWDFSVEFTNTGGVELEGIQIDGEQGEMVPHSFGSIDEAFKKEFDSRVGR